MRTTKLVINRALSIINTTSALCVANSSTRTRTYSHTFTRVILFSPHTRHTSGICDTAAHRNKPPVRRSATMRSIEGMCWRMLVSMTADDRRFQCVVGSDVCTSFTHQRHSANTAHCVLSGPTFWTGRITESVLWHCSHMWHAPRSIQNLIRV